MNPYKTLDIEKGAAKRDIIQAAARAMREKQYTGREIAEAQKALMNPINKTAHEFIHFINVKTLQDRLDLPQLKAQKIFCLEYCPVKEKEL